MRLGLWALAALFLGALGAHFLLQDRGYVLINFHSYVIEMSVPVLVMVLIALYALLRVAAGIWRAPRRLGEAIAERRHRRAGEKLMRGVMQLTEGHFSRGERLLTRNLHASDAPLVNYLMAARAAQLQGSAERRNEWLKLAYEQLPEAETTVLLTQAQMQFEAGEHEHALASLRRVQESRPDHPVMLALLAQTYAALRDWSQLAALLPRLDRARLSEEARRDLIAEALEHAYRAADLNAERVDALWSGVPASERKTPQLVSLHVEALERVGRGQDAERELRAALKQSWDRRLIDVYGKLDSGDLRAQLRRAESWLQQHPEDGALLLAAARLCMGNKLWGKARSYLESSLALEPQPAAYALYGRLLGELGESEEAAIAFRSGLGLVSGEAAGTFALEKPPEKRPAPSDAKNRG